jgi:hypothetical protein
MTETALQRAEPASPIADRIAVAILLLVPSVLVSAPGLNCQFLKFDDLKNIAENPGIRDLSWRGIRPRAPPVTPRAGRSPRPRSMGFAPSLPPSH